MELDDLLEFQRKVRRWPRNADELASVAERVRLLTGLPWVVFGSDGAGFAFSAKESPGEPSTLPLIEHVKQQLLRAGPPAEGEEPLLTQIALPPEASALSGSPESDQLAAVPLRAPAGNGRAPAWRSEQGDGTLGWIAAGFRRPLGQTAEAFLLAAAQHLSGLAIVHEADSAVALRDQFLSIASHELKTPLTSIYGILQLQERMLRPRPGVKLTAEGEKQLSFFKIVIRQVERLNELINGLLDVSRIQVGRFGIEPSEADASALLRETVGTRLAILAEEAGVRLDIEAPPELKAWIDPVRFEEVITNLVMNGIRFSPEGGEVSAKLSLEGDDFVLRVRDQGPNVPEADRSRIFQPFERAERTGRLGGLGLGLFISRQIARLHGGDVRLLTGPAGKAHAPGNVFEARFPLRTTDSSRAYA